MNFKIFLTGVTLLNILLLSSVVDAKTSAVNQGWVQQPTATTGKATKISELDALAMTLFTSMQQGAEEFPAICATSDRYSGLSNSDFSLAVITCYNNGYPASLIYTDSCRNTHNSIDSKGQPIIPTPSQISRCDTEKSTSKKADWVIWEKFVDAYNNKGQIDANLTGFSQTYYGSKSSTNLELTRFVWHASDQLKIPFYLLASSIDADDQDSIKSKALDNNSGTFNLQVSGHKMMESSQKGLFCDHSEKFSGGCYYGFEMGMKAFNDDSDPTMYLSSYFDYESSIFGEGKDVKAGTVKFGAAFNFATNDADKMEEQFAKAGRSDLTGVDSSMLFVSFYFTANIDEYASISASYVPISSDSIIKDNLIYSLNYNAIEF